MSFFNRFMSINEVQRQIIASFSSKIVYTLLGFLSTIYFARNVGPSVLGTYFLFISYFGLIEMISDGGLGRAAVKRISEGEEESEYYSAFFVLRIIATMFIVLLLLIFRNKFSDSTNIHIVDWIMLAQIASLIHCLVAKGIAGRGKMGIFALGELTNNALRPIIQIMAVFFGYAAGGLVGGFLLGLLAATFIQLKFFDLYLTKFEWKHIKNLITFSFWLFLTSTGVVLYSYADAIMIGYFIDEASVGIYKIAFQLTTFTTLVATTLTITLWPKISHWSKKGNKEYIEKAISYSITFSLLLALPIIAGGILLGDKILYFFYGAEFAVGYFTLIILFCAQLLNIFQSLFAMCLSALDKQKDSFKVTAIGAISNIILNIVLIPLFGIEGAAFATFITLGINTVLAKIILLKIIKYKLETKSLINIIISSLFMSFCILTYRYFIVLDNLWNVLFAIILGALIYIYMILKQDLKMRDKVKNIYMKINFP
ncbi:polysaccharide biosynthesis protein [Methanolobus psychrophilus R15]|nr:polysaccharide biosynthesis protein [Methanolobus psychrophilus R15]